MSMPLIENFFLSLGYVTVDEEKMQYSKEDVGPLVDILQKIKEYEEKYEQVPEEALLQAQRGEEEEKKRKQEFEKLQVRLQHSPYNSKKPT